MDVKNNRQVVYLIFIGLFVAILLDSIFSLGSTNFSINNYYGAIVVPLIGGIIGLRYFKNNFDQRKSYRLKTILFLSLTLIFWSIGTAIFTYLVFYSTTEVPYPSVADVSYVACGIFSVVGMYYLASWLGVKGKIKEYMPKVIFVAVSIIVLGLSYDLYAQVFQQDIEKNVNIVKIALDVFYPFTDALNLWFISLGCLLTKEKVFTRWNPVLFIYAGSIISYCANYLFSVSTTNNAYVLGNWVDVMFSVAMSLMVVGVLLLLQNFEREKV